MILFIWFYLIISSQTNNIYITIFFIFIYVIFDFNDSFYCNLIKLEYSVFILIIFFWIFVFQQALKDLFSEFLTIKRHSFVAISRESLSSSVILQGRERSSFCPYWHPSTGCWRTKLGLRSSMKVWILWQPRALSEIGVQIATFTLRVIKTLLIESISWYGNQKTSANSVFSNSVKVLHRE